MKYDFKEIIAELKLWRDAERRMGHQVDEADIVLEFRDRLEWHISQMQAAGKDEVKLKAFRNRLDKMKRYNLQTDRLLGDSMRQDACEVASSRKRYS